LPDTAAPLARDNRGGGMIGDSALREQELGGKTRVIVGLGRIGS
jgi:phosphoglycerate dehydrogenase-like enzyme